MSPAYALRHVLFEKRKQKVPLRLVQGNGFRKILIKFSAVEELRRNILVENRRAEVKGLLANINLIQNFRIGKNPAEAETRSEYLRE